MGKKVIALEQAAPDAALDGLNRLTGLEFSRWPESLVNQARNSHVGQDGVEVRANQVSSDRVEGQQENPPLAAEA